MLKVQLTIKIEVDEFAKLVRKTMREQKGRISKVDALSIAVKKFVEGEEEIEEIEARDLILSLWPKSMLARDEKSKDDYYKRWKNRERETTAKYKEWEDAILLKNSLKKIVNIKGSNGNKAKKEKYYRKDSVQSLYRRVFGEVKLLVKLDEITARGKTRREEIEKILVDELVGLGYTFES